MSNSSFNRHASIVHQRYFRVCPKVRLRRNSKKICLLSIISIMPFELCFYELRYFPTHFHQFFGYARKTVGFIHAYVFVPHKFSFSACQSKGLPYAFSEYTCRDTPHAVCFHKYLTRKSESAAIFNPRCIIQASLSRFA